MIVRSKPFFSHSLFSSMATTSFSSKRFFLIAKALAIMGSSQKLVILQTVPMLPDLLQALDSKFEHLRRWEAQDKKAGVASTDAEFGRVQARDMLQHLWTGPSSNSNVDVVQGSKSIEVRPVGVSTGAAIDRILGEIVRMKPMTTPIDCFLSKDEDVYSFFEPEPSDLCSNGKLGDSKYPRIAAKSNNKVFAHSKTFPISSSDHILGKKKAQEETEAWEGSSVLDLKGENYFSCAVGRKRSVARYSLGSTEEVITFLKEIVKGYPEVSHVEKAGRRKHTERSPRLAKAASNP